MPHIDEYKTIVKLEQLNYLLDDLHYELTNEEKTECIDTIKISDMVWNAKRRKEEEVYAMEEKEKQDPCVYVVIQKIKNPRKEEVVLGVLNECFPRFDMAVQYVKGHYSAKNTKLFDTFTNDDFVYNIRKINIVSEYNYDEDRIILRKFDD